MDFEIQGGSLIESPTHFEHKRAKNWLATVESDPQSPGGLKRNFWEKGNGKFLYILPKDLKLNQFIEFGLNYSSASGNQIPERWYGRIIGISDTKLNVEKCIIDDIPLPKPIESLKVVYKTGRTKPPYELQGNLNGYWERLVRVNTKDEAKIAFEAFMASTNYVGKPLRVLDKSGFTPFSIGFEE